jgi:hypothetical protein
MSSQFDEKTGVLPPLTNRGADEYPKSDISDCFKIKNTPDFLFEKKSRKITQFCTDFDWFQGTVFFPVDDLLDDKTMLETFREMVSLDLFKLFPDAVHLPDVKSVNKYQYAEQYNDPKGNRILLVEWGRNPGVHLTASGWYSRDIAPILQTYGVQITRADVAHDVFQYPVSFETVAAKIIKFAKQNKLKIDQKGDWTKGGERGRSLYIGSKKSRVYLNLYEKAFENGDPNIINAFPDWFRFEFRFRPQDKQAKQQITHWQPLQFLGSVPWVKELCELLKIDLIDSGNMRPPERTDDFEIKKMNFFRQYKNLFNDLALEAGGFENFGDYVQRQLKKYA